MNATPGHRRSARRTARQSDPTIAAAHTDAHTDAHTPTPSLSAADRRPIVAELWLSGVGQREMARQLNVSLSTIQRDLELIQGDLQRERLGDFDRKLNAAIAVRRKLQTQMWLRLDRAPDNAQNVPGLATVILQAQDAIDKLEGVAEPEKVNASTILEVQEVVMQMLGDVGGATLQQEFLRRLRTHTGDTGRRVLGAAPAASSPPAVSPEVVEAD